MIELPAGIKGFNLERLGVQRATSKQREGKDTKFVCTAVTVYANTEEEARQIASTPRVLKPGQKVLPDNTIDPSPPYAWCMDEDPAAWLDPSKTTCTSFPCGPHNQEVMRGSAQFVEVLR